MAREAITVFSALDTAKTQRYHFTAILITGIGFFTDAYDLFCITIVTKLLGRLYYYNPDSTNPGVLPNHVNNAITGVALCGTLAGQLFFGWLGDKLGRKKVYGITLITMVVCAIASGFSMGATAKSVMTCLCFFRFWLGFAIGGDYPLSAVIMSEYANQKTRGAFIAAIFAMQGFGILVAGAVAMAVSKAFLVAYPAPNYSDNRILSTQSESDFVWRIVLMFGAIPAMLTYYLRMMMPETARFTLLVEGNHQKAAEDMAKVLEIDIPVEEGHIIPSRPYGLFSKEFMTNHGLHLLGTTSTWFLLDITFYSLQLTQKDIYSATRLLPEVAKMNAIEEVFELAKAMSLVALFSTIPGYWFTVLLIDHIGRFIIQVGGFLLMSIFTLLLGILYEKLIVEECDNNAPSGSCHRRKWLFVILYGLTFFFTNFGPNTTTFILPAELFPARFRSTCHGFSGAAGKAGAVIGAFLVQSYALGGEKNKIKQSIIGLSVVNFIGFLFSFLLPETKGRTLEEISRETRTLATRISVSEII